MKSFVALTLSVSILFSSFGKTALVVHYLINMNYYAHIHCVNQGNPQMHCNGKCALAKELKEEERKSSVPFNTLKIEKEITWTNQAAETLTLKSAQSPTKHFSTYFLSFSSDNPSAVFQPPEC